jgi:hypothetical protein
MRPRSMITFSVITLLLWSCSPNTRITGSWIKPSAKGQLLNGKTLFVTSLTRNMEVRNKLENAFAQQFNLKNIKVNKSTEHFSPDYYQKLPTQKQLLSHIKNTGANLILTMSMIDKKSKTRYVPGSRGYAPFPYYRWYGGFYSYYNYWRPMFYEPGYYMTDKSYFMETNLYDVATDQLLWSAQSETVNPGSINNFVQTYPQVLVTQMIADGLL